MALILGTNGDVESLSVRIFFADFTAAAESPGTSSHVEQLARVVEWNNG